MRIFDDDDDDDDEIIDIFLTRAYRYNACWYQPTALLFWFFY